MIRSLFRDIKAGDENLISRTGLNNFNSIALSIERDYLPLFSHRRLAVLIDKG